MGGSPRTLAEGGVAPPPPPPPPSHMQQQQQHLQLMSNPLDGYCTWDRGAGGVAGGEGDYQVGWQLGAIVKKHLRAHTDARFVSPQKKVLFYGLFYRKTMPLTVCCKWKTRKGVNVLTLHLQSIPLGGSEHIYHSLDQQQQQQHPEELGSVDVMLPDGRLVPATLVRSGRTGKVVPVVEVDALATATAGTSVSPGNFFFEKFKLFRKIICGKS